MLYIALLLQNMQTWVEVELLDTKEAFCLVPCKNEVFQYFIEAAPLQYTIICLHRCRKSNGENNWVEQTSIKDNKISNFNSKCNENTHLNLMKHI